MKTRNKSTLLFLLLILPSYYLTLFAQDAANPAGTASNLFLRFNPNPRVSGLSESFTGLADDENTLFYNPAGLATMEMAGIGLNHTQWFESIRVDNLSFGYNINRKMGIGAAISHLWMPAIQGRDAIGQETEDINVSSSIINIGYGYTFTNGFSGGLAFKYFQDALTTDYKASGVAFDVGLHLKTGVSGLSLGLAVQNIGGKIQYDQAKESIPFTYRFGAAYKMYEQNLTFTTDLVKTTDTDINFLFGTEYVLQEYVTFRIGNRFAWYQFFNPAFGIGFNLEQQYHLNYTFVTYTDLGMTHRIGFTFNFNAPARTKWLQQATTTPTTGRDFILRPPEKVKVEVKGDRLVISWGAVLGASYNIYARHSSKQTWTRLNKIPRAGTSISFKKPAVAGQYYFRVSAVLENNESANSEEVVFDVP